MDKSVYPYMLAMVSSERMQVELRIKGDMPQDKQVKIRSYFSQLELLGDMWAFEPEDYGECGHADKIGFYACDVFRMTIVEQAFQYKARIFVTRAWALNKIERVRE